MDLLGKTLGNYRIDRLLGEGGMGAVYHAYDITLQREVAIKLVHPHLARQSSFRDRFIHEARIMAHLDHPGIVRVYHMDVEKDLLYLPMEFIKGGNLRQLLDRLILEHKWIPLNEAVLLVQQLCRVVEYAHTHGVLHRDIKPANLMIKPEPTDGLPFRVVLTDLGLAKLLEGLGMTQEGTYLGTPAYMSPEQASGKSTDARSDVYSLGILLYELVVGRIPFPIRSANEATHYHTQVQPPAPSSIRPELPEALERVILKALEKEPGDRYPSAAALGTAVSGSLGSTTAIIDQADPDSVSLITEYQTSLIASPPAAASLMTVLGHEPTGPQEAPVFGNIPPSHDVRIQVIHKEHTAKVLTLRSGTVTIGRDPGNHIVLDDEQVSRRHAQITWDGLEYHVMDLDSSNGTYLENVKLLPGVSALWQQDQILRIGDTWLRLIQPAVKLPGASETETRSMLQSTALFTRSSDGLVGASVLSQQISVEAGGSVTLTISLINQSPNVDHFSLALTGIPSNWVANLPPSVYLMPGKQTETTFTLQVPRSPQSQAGPYPMKLAVTSQRDPSQFVEVELILTVAAYSQFIVDLRPKRMRPEQAGHLSIANQGNQQETFTVTYTDEAEELKFVPPQSQIRIPEGQSVTTEFRAVPLQTRWFGGEKSHSIRAQVSVPNAAGQTAQAELLSRAFFPAWVPPVLLLLCFALLGLFGLIGPRLLPTPMPTLTPSVTPELGAPVVEEWCVYASNGPAPTSLTDCNVQVTAEVGDTLIIQWRVSNADEVIIEPFGNRPLSGEMRVTATEGMAAFGLKASNATGKSIQKSIQINVIIPSGTPPPTTVPPTEAIPPTVIPPTTVPPAEAIPPTTAPPPPPVRNIDDAIQLPGPKVAANEADKWVLAMGNRILVITADGTVFAHTVTANSVMDAIHLPGPKVAANKVDGWVLAMDNRILVITTDGSVFAHTVTANSVTEAPQLPGPKVAANKVDRWVLAMDNRILVITADGTVFAHTVTANSVTEAPQLRGPKVAANGIARRVLAMGNRILVITNDGSIFAHTVTANRIRDAVQLTGPKVAANPVDKWLLAMDNRILVITTDGSVFAHRVDD